jgi:MoaA/NifB/PqqE/SkfB family radical SAM enzyme
MDVTGFHIEPTNICTLKCAGCARTRFIQQWPQRWRNHNLDIDHVMAFLDIDLADKKIHLCGNYGDPIYHPNLVDMVAAFKNRNAVVEITTNGSYRTEKWWHDLCDHLDSRDLIRFSIDGIPENFAQYRVNANWSSIETGIKVCVARKIKTRWKYIPFSYNVASIDQAKKLSQDLGVTEFQLDASDRFDSQTEYLIPKEDILGRRFDSQQQFKQGISQSVDPECAKGRAHFITATGHFSPCCYVADHRFYYKTDFGKNSKIYNITDTTFSQIVNRPTVIEFYKTIMTEPPTVCQFNCPKTQNT